MSLVIVSKFEVITWREGCLQIISSFFPLHLFYLSYFSLSPLSCHSSIHIFLLSRYPPFHLSPFADLSSFPFIFLSLFIILADSSLYCVAMVIYLSLVRIFSISVHYLPYFSIPILHPSFIYVSTCISKFGLICLIIAISVPSLSLFVSPSLRAALPRPIAQRRGPSDTLAA